jgi:hypothetical protein
VITARTGDENIARDWVSDYVSGSHEPVVYGSAIHAHVVTKTHRRKAWGAYLLPHCVTPVTASILIKKEFLLFRVKFLARKQHSAQSSANNNPTQRL